MITANFNNNIEGILLILILDIEAIFKKNKFGSKKERELAAVEPTKLKIYFYLR